MSRSVVPSAGRSLPSSYLLTRDSMIAPDSARVTLSSVRIGDLPSGGTNSSIATYDNVNKSISLFMGHGDELIADYIKNVSAATTLAADVDGQTRNDEISNNMKLNQGALPTFSEI